MDSWHLFPKDSSAGSHRRASKRSMVEDIGAGEDFATKKNSLLSLDPDAESRRGGLLSPNEIRRFLATTLSPGSSSSPSDQDEYEDATFEASTVGREQHIPVGSSLFKSTSYLSQAMNPFSNSISYTKIPLKTSPFPDLPSKPGSPDYFGRSSTPRPPSDSESKYSHCPSERRPSSPFDLDTEPLLPDSPYKPLTPSSISQSRDSTSPSQRTTFTIPRLSGLVHSKAASLFRPSTPTPKSAHTSTSMTLQGTPPPSLCHTISTELSPNSSYSTLNGYSSTPSSPGTVTTNSSLHRTRFFDSVAKPKARDSPVDDEIRYHDLMASYHHRRATSSFDSPLKINNVSSLVSTSARTQYSLPDIHVKPRASSLAIKNSIQSQCPEFVFPNANYASLPSPCPSTEAATPTSAPANQSQAAATATAATFPILFPLLSSSKSPHGNTSGFDWDESPPLSPRRPSKMPLMKKVKSLGNLNRTASRNLSRGRTRTRTRTGGDSRKETKTLLRYDGDQKEGAVRLGSQSISPGADVARRSNEIAGGTRCGARGDLRRAGPQRSECPSLPLPVPLPVPLPKAIPTVPSPLSMRLPVESPLFPPMRPDVIPKTGVFTSNVNLPNSPPAALTAAATSAIAFASNGESQPTKTRKQKKLAKLPIAAPITSTPMNTPMMSPVATNTGDHAGLLRRCARKLFARGR